MDDRIELNRQMSETLESMARALFKAWFVDFEPVRAKMEGRWQRGDVVGATGRAVRWACGLPRGGAYPTSPGCVGPPQPRPASGVPGGCLPLPHPSRRRNPRSPQPRLPPDAGGWGYGGVCRADTLTPTLSRQEREQQTR
jgi:hypothetical protein